jgi:F0F1-type ATP synthase assembly protein I
MAGRDPKRGGFPSYARQVGILTLIPTVLAVSPIVGYFIGHELDKRLGTDPYLMILFIVLGFVAGGREVARLVRRATEEESGAKRDEHGRTPPDDGA